MVRLFPWQVHLTGANRPRALTHEVKTSALAERREVVPVYNIYRGATVLVKG